MAIKDPHTSISKFCTKHSLDLLAVFTVIVDKKISPYWILKISDHSQSHTNEWRETISAKLIEKSITAGTNLITVKQKSLPTKENIQFLKNFPNETRVPLDSLFLSVYDQQTLLKFIKSKDLKKKVSSHWKKKRDKIISKANQLLQKADNSFYQNRKGQIILNISSIARAVKIALRDDSFFSSKNPREFCKVLIQASKEGKLKAPRRNFPKAL